MCYTPIEHSLTTSSYTAEKRAAIGVSRTLTTITTFILMQSELAKACEIHPRVKFNNKKLFHLNKLVHAVCTVQCN